jgi:hypothetical protein
MNTEKNKDPVSEEQLLDSGPPEIEKYVTKRYDDAISYYWKAGGVNKRTYKTNRSLVIILGALVTVLSSLSSATFIEEVGWLKTIFAVATPVSAAVLTMINGFTQSFQSGAAWRDMVLNAERLEKERDRFLATPDEAKNYKRELNIINTIVVNESTSFFKRILDSEYGADEEDEEK